MDPPRSRFIVATGFLVGAFCVIPGMMRDSGAADGPPQTRPAAGAAKEAVKTTRQVLREAARAVQSVPDATSRAYALAEIIKAQGRAGDKEGALESARQAAAAALALDPRPRCWALVAIAWARSTAGDRDGALNTLRMASKHAESIDNGWDQADALRMIATAQFDLGEPATATETIAKLRMTALANEARGNNRLGPLTNLVEAQTYVGDADGAFRTVNEVRVADRHLQGQLYEAMVAAATADRGYYLQPPKPLNEADRKVRRQVLDRIIKAIEPFEFADERPDMQLAFGLARLGDFEAALSFAHRFGKGRIKHPSSIDLTAAPLILSSIGGYQGKAGQVAEARRTLDEALAMVQAKPRLAAQRLGQIALGQAQAGDIAGALKSVESLEPEHRINILTEMAEEQEKRAGLASARPIFRRTLEAAERSLRAPRPDPEPEPAPDPTDLELQRKDSLLARMVKCQAKLGDLAAALETFRSIRGENYRGWAARDIADARSQAGDVEGALAWALALDVPSVRAWALRGLATGMLAER